MATMQEPLAIPTKALTKDERGSLSGILRGCRSVRPGTEIGDPRCARALAVLWLQVCHIHGFAPESAKGKTGPNWERVAGEWISAAGKMMEVPTPTLRREWAEPTARLAARLFDEEVQARRKAALGSPLDL